LLFVFSSKNKFVFLNLYFLKVLVQKAISLSNRFL
jgi:hypothetical protein